MTKKEQKHGTFIHGCAASEHIDSSGERIIIDGVDISSLTKDGILNWEHKSDQATHIIGKILEAKKILTKQDCDNDYHRYFWDKVKMPFIYVAGELFDHVKHSSAQDVAAMLRYDKNIDTNKTKALINFSIEGSRLGKDGSNITKCIARKVTITIHPCNKMATAEEMDDPSQDTKKSGGIDISKEILSKFTKSEEIEIEIVKGELKQFPSLKNKTSEKRDYQKITTATGEHRPSKEVKPKKTYTSQSTPEKATAGTRIAHRTKKPKTGAQLYRDPKTFEGRSAPKQHWKTKVKKNTEKMKIDLMKQKKKKKSFYTSNVRKALTASCGIGAPSSRVGGAALQKECISGSIEKTFKKKKVLKSLSDEAWKNYQYKDELIDFIGQKQPELNKNEIMAVAKTYSYLEQVKTEKKLEDL